VFNLTCVVVLASKVFLAIIGRWHVPWSATNDGTIVCGWINFRLTGEHNELNDSHFRRRLLWQVYDELTITRMNIHYPYGVLFEARLSFSPSTRCFGPTLVHIHQTRSHMSQSCSFLRRHAHSFGTFSYELSVLSLGISIFLLPRTALIGANSCKLSPQDMQIIYLRV